MGHINLPVLPRVFSCPLSSWKGKLFIVRIILLMYLTGPNDLLGSSPECSAYEMGLITPQVELLV